MYKLFLLTHDKKTSIINDSFLARMAWAYEPFDEEIQKALFWVGMIIFISLCLIVVITGKDGLTGYLPDCVFRVKTGYWCPACGGTRSLDALVHGHILVSCIMHPAVPYGAAVCISFLTNRILYYLHLCCRCITIRPYHMFGGIFLIILHFMLRNICILAGCLF